ncbi:autotransporter outer membrane beta-barrel domain-containing protein [Stenotrophomonas rhizophila]|uniref:autotransporter outer membrane beta-barrel domain-containing protein n=1 Tax=Stenotrophomonas rhizophila TaxID=216778 RepID=UPI001E5D7304|nr:autotransporter outer membrane beta-barrel domain-containing protein [Stenotrophomonas rhizophila]MCC7635389.1 autotransporter outer membrane beta-barrel domain-containing protein [Stenotrophomonas rhizophila]MCC7664382.1 autotransporter outer membrane beta-barrel domain-containing protein [Stenotrophomonas rhizophila]
MRESTDRRLRFAGQRLARNRYEARAGAELTLRLRWSAWADLGSQRGDGGYRELAGQVGLRANW